MTRFAKLAALSAGCALALTAAPALADEPSEQEKMTKGEKELAKLLEGRVAGEPTRCINMFALRNVRLIDETAIIYEQGDTIWVNYTYKPEKLFGNRTALVSPRFGRIGRLCRRDNVTTRDRFDNYYGGEIQLSEFIPFQKAEGEG